MFVRSNMKSEGHSVSERNVLWKQKCSEKEEVIYGDKV
jgi:hypothetical protein